MSGSRDLHRKEAANRESRKVTATASEHLNAQRAPDSKQRFPSPRNAAKRLARDDSREHDSEVWHVSDDWPEFVPITLDEIEVSEAFLRSALDELLKDK